MISLADLKAFTNVTVAADEPLLTELEQSAVAHVEKATGRYFGPPKEIIQTFSGWGGTLWLKEVPLGTPAIVVEQESGGNWTVIAVDDYEVNGRTLFARNGWPYGYRNIRVTYTAGYAAGQEPDDIRLAVMRLVLHNFNNRSPVIVGNQVNAVPMTVKETLGLWREVHV